jgi:hypothetical protein
MLAEKYWYKSESLEDLSQAAVGSVLLSFEDGYSIFLITFSKNSLFKETSRTFTYYLNALTLQCRN